MRAHIVQPHWADIWRERAWIVVAIVAGVLALLAIYGFATWRLSDRAQDIAGRPLLTGTGTAVATTARAGTRGNMGDQTPFYEVRLDGKLYWYSTPEAIQVGQPVTVKYRVGRSGNVYMEGLDQKKP